MTIGIGTLGMSFNLNVITQGNVYETTLIGVHRRQGHCRMLANSTGSCRGCHCSDLVMTSALISLDVHRHWITKTELFAHHK